MKVLMSIQETIERVEGLDKRIAEYPYWGAALTAMDEERRSLLNGLFEVETFLAKRRLRLATFQAETR